MKHGNMEYRCGQSIVIKMARRAMTHPERPEGMSAAPDAPHKVVGMLHRDVTCSVAKLSDTGCIPKATDLFHCFRRHWELQT